MHVKRAHTWRTYWQTVPAAVWNEHHDSIAPKDCTHVLVGVALELDGEPITSMGFALSDELMGTYTMDEFIDEVAFAELLDEVRKVRLVGDVVVNYPGELEPVSYAGPHA